MFVCSCFGITEEQVREHASAGRCTPRQIASDCKAGTDCGSCVRRIQALLGRGAGCARGELLEDRQPAAGTEGTVPMPVTAPDPVTVPDPVAA
ncbi:(2Fe-2S)-binding protein [Streptomyces sp. WMMC500]|uniref:(2Fe-2S)-binding protein n=1 Tax=Streptomyces sp. WMMC500 TaxID=3015154 RepID=UPI00248C31FB|nr:(2Fe-2S)-binding protein [Streptomyces sp. WMMC500]WBB59875.1 (2Fe-2S)-binding protein [Streptomyces sp. WMMC500]